MHFLHSNAQAKYGIVKLHHSAKGLKNKTLINVPNPSRIRPEESSIVRRPGFVTGPLDTVVVGTIGMSMTAGLDDVDSCGGGVLLAAVLLKAMCTFSVARIAAGTTVFVVESGVAAGVGRAPERGGGIG